MVVVLSSVAGVQVVPPPFEPIPGTYNDPAKPRLALYMSVEGMQGKYVRRFEPPPKKDAGIVMAYVLST